MNNLKCSAICLLLFFCVWTCNFVYAASNDTNIRREHRSYYDDYDRERYGGRNSGTLRNKMEIIGIKQEQLEKQKKEIRDAAINREKSGNSKAKKGQKRADDEIASSPQYSETEKQALEVIDKKLKKLQSDSDDILSQIDGGRKIDMGNIIAYAAAGPENWKMLQDVKIDGIAEGLSMGMSVRAIKEVGGVVGDKVRTTAEKTIGSAWDVALDGGLSWWTKLWNWLMHGSKTPYLPKDVFSWKEIVKDSCDDIKRLLSDELRESSRSRDMTLRQFEDAPATTEAGQQVQQAAWLTLMEGYIEQIDYIVLRLQTHKTYYEKNDIIVYYASQIQRQLLRLKKWLQQAKSLKDLDTFLDSNKLFVSALSNNIDCLFTRFIDKLDVRSEKTDLTSSSFIHKPSSKIRDRDEDLVPGAFMGR